MSITYIYGIRALDIAKFIYIGKSNTPPGRFMGHMRHADNDCVREFVKEKGADNFQVEQLETVEFEVSRDWIRQEKLWIKKFRKEGHPLCNKNDGGGGPTEVSAETRAKMREDRIGENNPFYGKHHTEEVKREQSERMSGENHPNYGKVGYWAGKKNPEQSKRMSGKNHPLYGLTGEDNPNYGRQHTKEDIARMRASRPNQSGENNPFYHKHHTREAKDKMSVAKAKPYPAFYNVKTEELIPAGKNLLKLCQERRLKWDTMFRLKYGKTKQSRDGWRLAKERN